jgi:nucleoside-diphosphate-sugar epimerase
MMRSDGVYPTFSGKGAERLSAGPWRIVVVGASGWLGLASLEALYGLLGGDFFKRVACLGSTARSLALRGSLTVPQERLESMVDLPPAPTMVLHFAFLTQEKAKAMSANDYIAANEGISELVLTALDKIGAEAVFVPSSGAAYLADDSRAAASMRLYGRLKLDDEARFAAWADTRAKQAVIARVFNLSGPYINKQSSYALACFIADALAGRSIVVRAKNPVFRSYVAVRELMSVALGALTGPTTEPIRFDTAGDDVYEMAAIAGMVEEALHLKVGIELPSPREGEPDRYLGDGAAYRRLRQLHDVESIDFHNQIRETARFMAEASAVANWSAPGRPEQMETPGGHGTIP